MIIWQIPISYSDLGGERPTETDLASIVGSFVPIPTFFLLARLNVTLSFYSHDPQKTSEVQQFLFEHLVSEGLREVAVRKFNSTSFLARPIFHRQQMLFLMRRLLVQSTNSSALDPQSDENARHELGRACLIVNDLLNNPDELERLNAAEAVGSDAVHDELFSQMIFSSEMSRVPDVAHSLARMDEYLDIFERPGRTAKFSGGRSLSGLFKDLTSLDPRHFLRLIYLLYGNYSHVSKSLRDLIENPKLFNVDKGVIFSKLSFSDAEIDSFFNQTTRTLDSLKVSLDGKVEHCPDDARDFTAFRSRPLVYTQPFDTRFATCVDFEFLVEKPTSGIYHTILTEASVDDVKVFQQSWGKTFETYINERLESVFPQISNRLYCCPFFDLHKEEREAFDGFLDYGNMVMALQYKGGYLKRGVKYGGSSAELVKDFDKKIGYATKQLGEGLERAFNRNIAKRVSFSERPSGRRFDVEGSKQVRVVYPLIVVQDQAINVGFAQRRLRRLFERQLEVREIEKQLVRPLTLLTVEELERTIAYLDEGIAFTEILEDYILSKPEPILTYKDFLGDYLRRKGIKPRLNEWTQQRFREINDAIRDHFTVTD